MLITSPETAQTDPALRVRIEVSSVVVRLALCYVSRERGWRVYAGQGHDRPCVWVSDRNQPNGGARVDVLITKDDPASCQGALDAVLAGTARSVVLWDEPESLVSTIEAMRHGSAVVPERVIGLALDAPRLNERQRKTLRLVAAGRSNSEIALGLYQSSSTTKRDIAELLKVFDVANRAALMAVANRLGFL